MRSRAWFGSSCRLRTPEQLVLYLRHRLDFSLQSVPDSSELLGTDMSGLQEYVIRRGRLAPDRQMFGKR